MLFSNFGPFLVFYTANYFINLKAAIALSIAWVVGEIIYHLFKKIPLSMFFKFSATVTIAFGLVDLYLQKSLLFKYEASLSNAAVGVFFVASLFGEKPIIREFAEARGQTSKTISPDNEYYFKFLTVIWSGYMFGKALFYFWVAENYSLEEGLAIRAGIGTISFYALLGISIFASKPIKLILGKMRLLPSTKRTELSAPNR